MHFEPVQMLKCEKCEGWVRGGFGIGYLNGDVRGTFLGIHLLLVWVYPGVRHKIEDMKSSPDPGSRFKIKGCCNQWGHTPYILYIRIRFTRLPVYCCCILYRSSRRKLYVL